MTGKAGKPRLLDLDAVRGRWAYYSLHPMEARSEHLDIAALLAEVERQHAVIAAVEAALSVRSFETVFELEVVATSFVRAALEHTGLATE